MGWASIPRRNNYRMPYESSYALQRGHKPAKIFMDFCWHMGALIAPAAARQLTLGEMGFLDHLVLVFPLKKLNPPIEAK